MRTETDRFARERKELTEQIQDAESQIEWLRSEKDDEIAKLVAEKKNVQDRLHDAEAQLAQLRSRKRDELKVALQLHFANYLVFEILHGLIYEFHLDLVTYFSLSISKLPHI